MSTIRTVRPHCGIALAICVVLGCVVGGSGLAGCSDSTTSGIRPPRPNNTSIQPVDPWESATEPEREEVARHELKGMLQESIQLIEQKKFQQLFEQFFSPELRSEALEKEGSLDGVLKALQSESKDLLADLKESLREKPQLRERCTEAEFQPHGTSKLVFQRIDGTWYLVEKI